MDGGGDQGYSGGRNPGLDGNAQNGVSNTGLQANGIGVSGTGGSSGNAFLAGGLGNIYGRNSQFGYGGFGCGVANDDIPGFGGGYTLGTSSTAAYSYCENAETRTNGVNEGQGKVVIRVK